MTRLADRSRLHAKANEQLDANLAEGETVEVVITGPSNQAIIGTVAPSSGNKASWRVRRSAPR
jgi:hypothetical protein